MVPSTRCEPSIRTIPFWAWSACLTSRNSEDDDEPSDSMAVAITSASRRRAAGKIHSVSTSSIPKAPR